MIAVVLNLLKKSEKIQKFIMFSLFLLGPGASDGIGRMKAVVPSVNLAFLHSSNPKTELKINSQLLISKCWEKESRKVVIAHEGPCPSDKDLALQSRLQLPMLSKQVLMQTGYELSLQYNSEGVLSLHFHLQAFQPVFVDFVNGKLAYRGDRAQQEAVLTAVQLKGNRTPTVWDMTAGFGRDAFILACGGCRVHMLEKSKLVGELLADGIRRLGLEQDARMKNTFGLMSMCILDSSNIAAIRASGEIPADCAKPEVAYIDPMFPPKGKAALPKKDLQVLQELIGSGGAEIELFNAAYNLCQSKVVVKRPIKGKHLADRTPSYCIKGTKNRFDVYVKNVA